MQGEVPSPEARVPAPLPLTPPGGQEDRGSQALREQRPAQPAHPRLLFWFCPKSNPGRPPCLWCCPVGTVQSLGKGLPSPDKEARTNRPSCSEDDPERQGTCAPSVYRHPAARGPSPGVASRGSQPSKRHWHQPTSPLRLPAAQMRAGPGRSELPPSGAHPLSVTWPLEQLEPRAHCPRPQVAGPGLSNLLVLVCPTCCSMGWAACCCRFNPGGTGQPQVCPAGDWRPGLPKLSSPGLAAAGAQALCRGTEPIRSEHLAGEGQAAGRAVLVPGRWETPLPPE